MKPHQPHPYLRVAAALEDRGRHDLAEPIRAAYDRIETRSRPRHHEQNWRTESVRRHRQLAALVDPNRDRR